MPLSIRASNQWQVAKNVYIRASGAWQNVKQIFIYANGAWRSVFSATKPPVRIRIWDPANNITVTTNSSRIIQARLEDEDGNQVAEVRSITWSQTGPGSISAFPSIPTQTNSDGSTNVTYSVQNTTGQSTISIASPGLQGTSRIITVQLLPALTPILSTSRFNEGYYLFHSNPNSSWSYSVSLSPAGTATFIGNILNFQSIVRIPPRNDSQPQVSTTSSLTYVECTRGSWTFQPFVTTTVTTTRTGYENGSSSAGDQPTGTTSFSYQWQYSTNGGSTWINWDSPQTEQLGSFVRKNKGPFYESTIKNNKLRCVVTGTRSGGTGGGSAISTTVFSSIITAV